MGNSSSHSLLREPKTVVVVGAPLADGQDWEEGVDQAPDELRQGGLGEVVAEVGWAVDDRGDVDCKAIAEEAASEDAYPPDAVKNAQIIGSACGRLYEEAAAAATEGKFVLTLGGDHSLASATIAAQLRGHKDLCVVWVDAHADCNTPETSPSRNYHGMPAAHVLGWFSKPVRGFGWMTRHLKEVGPLPASNLAYIGLRDVDAGEKKLLRDHGVTTYTMTDIDRLGIAEVMKQILEKFGPQAALHLSYDVDGIDPSVAPGTGTQARGGLTYREAHYVCESLAATGRLTGMDLVEINPVMDAKASPKTSPGSPALPPPTVLHGDNPNISGSATTRLGIELVASALGKTII